MTKQYNLLSDFEKNIFKILAHLDDESQVHI